MKPEKNDRPADLENRIQALEERLAFYEHANDSISETEFELERRVRKLEQANRQLEEEVRRLREALRDPFNPQQKKPPHY